MKFITVLEFLFIFSFYICKRSNENSSQVPWIITGFTSLSLCSESFSSHLCDAELIQTMINIYKEAACSTVWSHGWPPQLHLRITWRTVLNTDTRMLLAPGDSDLISPVSKTVILKKKKKVSPGFQKCSPRLRTTNTGQGFTRNRHAETKDVKWSPEGTKLKIQIKSKNGL